MGDRIDEDSEIWKNKISKSNFKPKKNFKSGSSTVLNFANLKNNKMPPVIEEVEDCDKKTKKWLYLFFHLIFMFINYIFYDFRLYIYDFWMKKFLLLFWYMNIINLFFKLFIIWIFLNHAFLKIKCSQIFNKVDLNNRKITYIII